MQPGRIGNPGVVRQIDLPSGQMIFVGREEYFESASEVVPKQSGSSEEE